MFNKILGKKDGSSPQKAEGKKNTKKNEDTQSQGFVCPICYVSFENSDILTNHYLNIHENQGESSTGAASNDESLIGTAESILKRYTSNNVTSDSESVHNDSKSISSFNDSLTGVTREQQLEKDLLMYKEKFQSAEEIRRVLTNDMNKLQDMYDQSKENVKKLVKDKVDYEEKLQLMTDELHRIKTQNENLSMENESVKTNLSLIQEEFVNKSQVMKNLESELNLRPTLDDINLLKKELVQVQQLTDTIVREKENEQKQLIREQNELKSRLEKKEEQLKSLNDKIETLKELDELKEKYRVSEETVKILENNEKNITNELKLKEETLAKKEDDINRANARIDELKRDLEQKTTQITSYLIEIKDLSQEKNQLNQTINELEIKKIELMNKLHSSSPSKSAETSVNMEQPGETTNNDQHEPEPEKVDSNADMLNLIQEKENIENELIKLKSKHQAICDEKIEWLNEKNEFLLKVQNLDQQINELNNVKSALESEKSNLIEDKQKLENGLREADEKRIRLDEEKSQITNEKQLIDENLTKSLSQINELNEKISQLGNENQNTLGQVEELKTQLDETKRTLESSREELNQLQTRIDDLNQKLSASENSNKEQNEKITRLEVECSQKSNELDDQKRLVEEQKQQVTNLETSIGELQLKLNQNISLIDELNKKNNEVEEEKKNLTVETDTLRNSLNDRDGQLNELRSQHERKEADHNAKLEEMNKKLADLEGVLQRDNHAKGQLESEIAGLKEQNEGLINSVSRLETELANVKVDLDKQLRCEEEMRKILDESERDIARLKTELNQANEAKDEYLLKAETLSKKVEKLSVENEEVKMERDDCDRMRLDAIKKHDNQLKALNQNLANLRVELKQQNEKLARAEIDLNVVKGNNLELEAKLSNCMDERNQLLERCVNAEKMCESFKSQNIELKRKYESSESALQELAREHQSLQVLQNRKSSYRWVDDSAVTDCTNCKKAFSVTVRRHHCRNCGQVFCNECSDNTAKISSNPKPQRVCKACYIELNN